MSDDQQQNSELPRDGRGRFVPGVSGNPAGRPMGIINEAARVAATLLNDRAPELVNSAIDRALAGKDVPMKVCLDKIIASPKDQPVAFDMSPICDIADLPGAIAALWNAVSEGLITPSQAASLSQALERQTRAIEARERIAARRAAEEAPVIWNRMQLRVCVAIADGVREIRDEAGEVDKRAIELCTPIIRIGRMALLELAKIEDHAAQIIADEAFVAVHPIPEDHPRHPLAAELAPLWQKLGEYLDDNMHWLERQIEERFAARQAAGEPDPIYRAWIFQPMEVRLKRKPLSGPGDPVREGQGAEASVQP
jgi:hypothetical protein